MLWQSSEYSSQVTPGQDVVGVSSLQANTDYFVSVGALEGTGSYQLTIRPLRAFDQYEPNDSILQAHRQKDSATIEGNLIDADDVDFFHFSDTASTLAVALTNGSVTLRPRVQIWRADKSRQWQNSQYSYQVTPGQDVATRVDLSPGSEFYISVSSFGGEGDYTLSVTAVQ